MEQSHLEVLLEDIRGKFELVLESHEILRAEIRENQRDSSERHGMAIFQIKVLSDRVSAVSAELQAKLDDFRHESKEKHDLTTILLKGVAADLAAHRADTEVHVKYRVRE